MQQNRLHHFILHIYYFETFLRDFTEEQSDILNEVSSAHSLLKGGCESNDTCDMQTLRLFSSGLPHYVCTSNFNINLFKPP